VKTETPDENPPMTRHEFDHEMEGFRRYMDDRPITRKEFDQELKEFREEQTRRQQAAEGK
jgi:hypothetical protein